MRQHCAHYRIEQRGPDQVAVKGHAEQMHRRRFGQSPENDDERAQRHDGVEKAGADRELDEEINVLGNALVRVVGGIAEKLHAIMVRGIEPLPQIGLRHPAAPTDLQPKCEIGLINDENGVNGCEDAKEDDRADETVPIVILQGVVKAVVPGVQNDRARHNRQFDADNRRQQKLAGPEWTLLQ